MTRSNINDARAEGLRFLTGSLGGVRRVLIEDIQLLERDLFIHFLDAGGSNRVVVLPPLTDETTTRVIHNIGTANDITVEDALGAVVTTLSPGEGAFCFGSDQEWIALRSWADLGVFGPSGPGHSVGLVPDPGAIAGAVRFLREDGQWASVHVVGIVDSFKNITDGVNTAVASGPDTFTIRGSTGAIVPTVTNNDVTYGDMLDLIIDEGQVDHNLLGNYDSDQHVNHSLVDIVAGEGLQGGGTIDASRTIDLDINGLTTASPAGADSIVFYDASLGGHRKNTISTLNLILVHDNLVGFVANEHIDHSAVSINAGQGLTGGGTIAATRTLSLDFSGLPSDDAPVAADLLAFYDTSESDHGQTTISAFNAILDHDTLSGFVANEHIDHTGVSINAGTGLQGGGTIAATRTLSLADAPAWSILANYSGSVGIPEPIALADIGVEATPAAGDFIFVFRADGVPVVVDWGDLPGAGSGDVVGPAGGVVDTELALFDGATGKLIQGSGLLITEVQEQDAFLDDIAALTDPNADRILFWDDSAGGIEWLTVNTGLEISGTTLRMTANQRGDAIEFVIDGGGAVITTGVKGYLEVPYGCTITACRMLADQSGSAVVDIWKDTYANFPPLDADSITASAVPTITTATKSQDTTLTGWTTSVTKGDILAYNVDSCSSITRLTIILEVTKT